MPLLRGLATPPVTRKGGYYLPSEYDPLGVNNDILSSLRYKYDTSKVKALTSQQCIQLPLDPDTASFARTPPLSPVNFGVRNCLKKFKLLSSYDADAVLGSPKMWMLSTGQWSAILRKADTGVDSTDEKLGRLLDIGGGQGFITACASPLFESVTATEVSWLLTWRLAQHGFITKQTDNATPETVGARDFDVISCLNVIDRCKDPGALLRGMAALLHPEHGRLVLSIVLPLEKVVKAAILRTVPVPASDPTLKFRLERSLGQQTSWEDAAAGMVEVFQAHGFEVQALSRAPYMCQGDNAAVMYVLDAAVFVLKPVNVAEPESTKAKMDAKAKPVAAGVAGEDIPNGNDAGKRKVRSATPTRQRGDSID